MKLNEINKITIGRIVSTPKKTTKGKEFTAIGIQLEGTPEWINGADFDGSMKDWKEGEVKELFLYEKEYTTRTGEQKSSIQFRLADKAKGLMQEMRIAKLEEGAAIISQFVKQLDGRTKRLEAAVFSSAYKPSEYPTSLPKDDAAEFQEFLDKPTI